MYLDLNKYKQKHNKNLKYCIKSEILVQLAEQLHLENGSHYKQFINNQKFRAIV